MVTVNFMVTQQPCTCVTLFMLVSLENVFIIFMVLSCLSFCEFSLSVHKCISWLICSCKKIIQGVEDWCQVKILQVSNKLDVTAVLIM